jgi:hypothetical protein
MLTANWDLSSINELDISSTELTENCLVNLFTRMPKLNYLAVPNCDGFTDQVDMSSRIFLFVFFLLQGSRPINRSRKIIKFTCY